MTDHLLTRPSLCALLQDSCKEIASSLAMR